MTGVINIDRPNPKQAEFLKCTAKYIAFGGARGGGKSWAVRTKAKLLALRYPGIKCLIVRKTYPELKENHIVPLRIELAGTARYNDSDKKFTFPNGSVIKLDYCATDSDLTHYQGTEWDIIFFEEATNLTEYQMQVISATNRGVNSFPKRIYFTCNPGGPGHQYIKRLFIDRNFEDNENPDDYVFIQSLVWDNEILLRNNPEYIQELEKLPEQKRKAWLEGEWEIFEGVCFSEFRNKPNPDNLWTHVIEPFHPSQIPANAKIYRCMDWGYSHPFCILWCWVADNGCKYVIREYYGCTGQPDKGVQMQHMAVAEEAHAIENSDPYLKGRKILAGPADPAIFSYDSHGVTIAGDMMRAPNYVMFTRGNNDRLNGKMQVHYHLAFDEQGQPLLQIFNTCKNLIRTLPQLTYDENKPEDVDTTLEDHAYDTLRYFLAEFTCPPRQNHKQNSPEQLFDPLNQRTESHTKIREFRHF